MAGCLPHVCSDCWAGSEPLTPPSCLYSVLIMGTPLGSWALSSCSENYCYSPGPSQGSPSSEAEGLGPAGLLPRGWVLSLRLRVLWGTGS